MIEQKYSLTRTRATWKPRVAAADLPFATDGAGNIVVGISGDEPAAFTGTGRTLVGEPPYAHLNGDAVAAGGAAVELIDDADMPEGVEFDYRIDGGFNNNCVIVSWKIADTQRYRLNWVCLKTFTGMQLKYAMPNKRPPLVFALAAEDAFAYCDKQPCEECAFRCKSGFYLYAQIDGLGLVRKSMDRISMLNMGVVKK